jgi:hypothetical protein
MIGRKVRRILADSMDSKVVSRPPAVFARERMTSCTIRMMMSENGDVRKTTCQRKRVVYQGEISPGKGWHHGENNGDARKTRLSEKKGGVSGRNFARKRMTSWKK